MLLRYSEHERTRQLEADYESLKDSIQAEKQAETESSNSQYKYKLLMETLMKQCECNEGEEEMDLKNQVIRLTKERELLLLNLTTISRDLEERIPHYQYQQQCYQNLYQNYSRLLILWNQFIGTKLLQEESNHDNHEDQRNSMTVLVEEVKRQRQENETMRKQIESLETVLSQFRTLLVYRGQSDLPEIETIFTTNNQQIEQLTKQVEECELAKSEMLHNNSVLRQNLALLESKQEIINGEVLQYVEMIKRLQNEVVELKSKLFSLYHNFDQSKINYTQLLGQVSLYHTFEDTNIIASTTNSQNQTPRDPTRSGK